MKQPIDLWTLKTCTATFKGLKGEDWKGMQMKLCNESATEVITEKSQTNPTNETDSNTFSPTEKSV